jgi:hypothetical protein
MNQANLFGARKPEPRSSPIFAKAEAFRKQNEVIARQALADPGRYGWLLDWARIVLRNAGAESEAA